MPNMSSEDVIVVEGFKRRFAVKKPRKAKSTKPKKKKVTKTDFLRSWGIYPGTWVRYSGLKGVYWFWFSRTIRERDYEKFGGICMTCNKYVEKGQDQAGHLFAASKCGFGLLFHPKNVHLQHASCNNPRITPSAGVFNSLNIAKRYGEGTIEALAKIQGTKFKEWSKAEYEERIKKLPAYKKHLNEKEED